MRGKRIAVFALLALPSAAWAAGPARPAGQDRLVTLRERFQAERDPVHQAKNFSKLGEALLNLMRTEADAGSVSGAQAAFDEYRDDLRRTVAALKATGRNAEKNPNGFKELQIYLRKTLRNIDQIILLVPFDERTPFEAVRREIASIDDELYRLLFPRQPDAKKP